jgi:hypothetical protein
VMGMEGQEPINPVDTVRCDAKRYADRRSELVRRKIDEKQRSNLKRCLRRSDLKASLSIEGSLTVDVLDLVDDGGRLGGVLDVGLVATVERGGVTHLDVPITRHVSSSGDALSELLLGTGLSEERLVGGERDDPVGPEERKARRTT